MSLSSLHHRDRKPILIGAFSLVIPDLVMRATGIGVDSATGGKGLK